MNFTIEFPAWPNREGHFGRVSAETHYKYESMAAPIVLMQRIKDDVAYTENPNNETAWNLPDELVPIEKDAGLNRCFHYQIFFINFCKKLIAMKNALFYFQKNIPAQVFLKSKSCSCIEKYICYA